MGGNTAVKAFVSGKKWMGRLIYWCATFLMTQFMSTVSTLPLLMPVPQCGLALGPSGVDEERKVDTRGREGRRREERENHFTDYLEGL